MLSLPESLPESLSESAPEPSARETPLELDPATKSKAAILVVTKCL